MYVKVITLETFGYKITGMTLSRVLTCYVRRDRVMSKTLNLLIISNSESSTKMCFFVTSAVCLLYCLSVCLFFCFCVLSNCSNVSVCVSA